MEDNTNQALENDLAIKVAALLKLEPLIGLDPNDQESLLDLVSHAHKTALEYDLDYADLDVLKLMSLAINQWGSDFLETSWSKRILSDKTQDSKDRVNELFLYTSFLKLGSDAIDFSSYAILTFQRKYPQLGYENKDVHVASQMALNIARKHEINDLLNSYSCVEIILFTSVDFTKDPLCKPLKGIFETSGYSPDEKIKKSFAWLNENLARINETIQNRE